MAKWFLWWVTLPYALLRRDCPGSRHLRIVQLKLLLHRFRGGRSSVYCNLCQRFIAKGDPHIHVTPWPPLGERQ